MKRTSLSVTHLEGIVGPSKVPTRYKLILENGEERYVRCGADLVLTGLNLNVSAQATCPICDAKIQFQIVGSKVEGLTVPGPMLYVVELPGQTQGRPSVECQSTNLFDGKTCLAKWASSYHGKTGKAYTVPNYLDHVRRFTRRVSAN